MLGQVLTRGLRIIDTILGEATMSDLVLLPSEMRSLKGKDLLSLETNSVR